jgi:hypothetical protein
MLGPFDPSRMEAKDEVMTTLLTLGALFFTDLSTPFLSKISKDGIKIRSRENIPYR